MGSDRTQKCNPLGSESFARRVYFLDLLGLLTVPALQCGAKGTFKKARVAEPNRGVRIMSVSYKAAFERLLFSQRKNTEGKGQLSRK